MPSEGPNNAATCVDDATVGTQAWLQITNAQGVINGNFATTGAGSGTRQCHYLKATDFSFAIPPSTVDGILVELQRKRMGNTCTDVHVRIVKGGAIGATNRSAGASWPSPAALTPFGGPTDKWGETWLYTDINSPTFGAVCAPQIINFTSGQVDAWLLTVYYTEVSGNPGIAAMMQVIG